VPRFTVKEAATYIPMAKSTLDKLRSVGGGPRFIKLRGKILYDQSDIDRWLDDHKQISTADIPSLRRGRRSRKADRHDPWRSS
jgi:predicted DNA-binding transcriptional regulator AlpA